MSKIAELELSLRPAGGSQYAVDLISRPADSDSDERLSSKAVIDPAALRDSLSAALSTSRTLPGDAYGRALGQALFADETLSKGFERARILAQGAGAKLRVRLTIDAAAPELHSVWWETLRDASGAELFNSPDIWFSRYLASTNWEPVHSRAGGALRALVVIASPAELADPDWQSRNPNGPRPIPVAEERDRAMRALQPLNVPPVVLANIEGADGRPTLDQIVKRLGDGFDILYLMCHGALIQGQPKLWLEKDDGSVQVTAAADLVAALSRMDNQLRVAVLASCQSAGTGASGDALLAFGPMLAAAGIPAVIAMQDKVAIDTMDDFMPKFLSELMRDGQIDRAMAEARGDAVTRKHRDYWVPVLFMRLRSGSLWYQAGFGENTDLDRWVSITAAMEDGQCTPILGPGLIEDIVGSTREIAQDLAVKYAFPLAPWSLEDLPTVAQYLAVNQSTQFPRRELRNLIRDRIAARFGNALPAELNHDDLNAVLKEVGRTLREGPKMDAHRLLASKPFRIYITVNPDELMEDALRDAGRPPQSEFARWNEKIADVRRFPTLRMAQPDYTPTVENPLVYHVFGKLATPESLVITEDDFFDYLLRIGSKADGKNLAPGAVGTSLTADALLFIGFRLDDWSFRVLLRSIYSKEGSGARAVGNDTLPCVGAQLIPDKGRILEPEGTRKYFEKYLRSSNIDIFWGRVDDFIRELDRQTARLTIRAKAAKAS
jgi:hypothetical protein